VTPEGVLFGIPQHSTAQHAFWRDFGMLCSTVMTKHRIVLIRSMAGSHHEHGRVKMAIHKDTVQLVKVDLSMHDPSCTPRPHACAD